MNSQRDTIIELTSWRRNNKEFALRVRLPKNDYIGWNNYWTFDLYNKSKNRIISSFRGRQGFHYFDREYYGFCNVLSNRDMIRAFREFYLSKGDILGGKVTQV
jgi:hypothetical protein